MLFSCMRCLCTTRSTAWFSSISILETSPMRRYSRRSRAPCAILVFFFPCASVLTPGGLGHQHGDQPQDCQLRHGARASFFFACNLDALARLSHTFRSLSMLHHHLRRACTMLVVDCRPCASRCTSQSSRVSPINTIFTTCASLTAIHCRPSP
jgi:hypothetical protein